MKRALLFFLLGAAGARADEWSLQLLPKGFVEYEGSGFRESPSGWELKVKPWNPVGGLRWRRVLGPGWACQAQAWANRATFAGEIGNRSAIQQYGQTSLAVQSLWVDLRRPLRASPVEVVFGVNGSRQVFKRKDIVFGVPEPETARETLQALGGHLGFHAGRLPGDRGFFWDGEILLGHSFWTRNRLRADGGTIDRGGYTYAFRWEGGFATPRWRLSAGYARQLYEVLVPGGRSLPTTGATVSLPINKTDLFGPFVAVGWTY